MPSFANTDPFASRHLSGKLSAPGNFEVCLKLCSIAAAILSMVVVVTSPVTAANRTPPDVVLRASRYVDDFVKRFSNVVAEERYVQESSYPHRRRELRSEFLLVSPPGAIDRYQFRDVLEVDGTAVRDRRDRLTKLFLEAPANALQRARDVARESERYNLASIGTLDQPLLAVGFLQSRYVNRFRYIIGSIERNGDAAVRYVAFEETTRPTIIKSTITHGDFPSRGYFLIDETSGRVVRSELDLGRGTPPPSIVTSFRFDDELQLNVPVEMHDPLGIATYGRFRKFAVETDEKVHLP
jgi:hypothetical protein